MNGRRSTTTLKETLVHSNFITPHDHIEDQSLHTVLLIDASDREVTEVVNICQIVGTDFNVYLYHADMEELKWLETAFNLSNAVVISTLPNALSPIKDRLAAHSKCFHYGPKNFFDNERRVESPAEYFITYVKKLSENDLEL